MLSKDKSLAFVIHCLRSAFQHFVNEGHIPFKYGIEKQKRVLDSFGEPFDDIERSFFQYRCQMVLFGRIRCVLLNLASIAPLLYLYSKRVCSVHDSESKEGNDVLLFTGSSSVLTPNIKDKYENLIQVRDFHKHWLLYSKDRVFIREIWKRHPTSPYFALKCLLKLGMYRYQIVKHRPKVIFVCDEYSFTSSMLTFYCKTKGIEHINVMHGEKLFSIEDAFFHFDKCYVWDEYYRDLFISLKAEPSQFIVEKAEFLQIRQASFVRKYVDFTYFLQLEGRDELSRLKRILDRLVERGAVLAIRPHPIYSDRQEVMHIFGVDKRYIIEDTDYLSIDESITRTKNAISLYSTVLLQALVSGTRIVIDDMTDIHRYRMLVDFKYMCLEKQHSLLSTIILNDQVF